MKHIIYFLFSFLFLGFQLQAQTLEEAQKLYKEKKYEAAGVIYYDLYMFDEAVEAFEKRVEFIDKMRKPDPELYDLVNPLLEKAERAARMLSHCENVQIIDSLVIDKNRFLDAYFLSDEAGELIPIDSAVIFENQLKDRRYLSKKDENDFYRLYSQTKLGNSWSEERLLNIPIDEGKNDNFPFVMPDGLTIYYASTGHGSIGGYDIFVTRYNLNSDSYLAPNQMGMPFNSIFNDYMLAIDEEYGIGFFVTDRFQPENKVVVYTFIPNEEYKPLEDLSSEELIARAKISSIRDSWKAGTNYASYIQNIKEDMEKRRQILKRDFTFVINDNIIYYSLDDFDSDVAKKSFLRYRDLNNEKITLEAEVSEQRKKYKLLSNSNLKDELAESILSNEKRLEEIDSMINESAKEARNSEIKHLRQSQ